MQSFIKSSYNNYVLTKVVNDNGCWIPRIKPLHDGYVQVTINNIRYKLHRLSMCLDRELDYNDASFETRHLTSCDRACFNPSHLIPGTAKQNSQDTVLSGGHGNSKKDKCPHCGRDYSVRMVKSGERRGRVFRFCRYCQHQNRKVKVA